MSAVVIPGGSAYQWERPQPEPWMDLAACTQVDPDMFFPEKGGSTRDAKKICRACPVASKCLGFALDRDERFGIWGGLSERERRALGKASGATAAKVRADLEAREEQVRRLHRLGQTDVEIAAALEVDPQIVGRVRRLLNLGKNSSGTVPLRQGAGPVRATAPKEERVMTVQQDRDVVGKRPGGRKPSPHGTDKRWKNGPCRDASICPGGADGKTCTAAHEEALAAARKGGTPADASEEIPTPQTGAEWVAGDDPASTPGVVSPDNVEHGFGGFDSLAAAGVLDTTFDAPRLDDIEAAEVERFGADYDDDGLLGDPVPAVDPEHFAKATADWIQSPAPLVQEQLVVGEPVEDPSFEELRARFGFTDPVAAGSARHGGLLADLERTRADLEKVRALWKASVDHADALHLLLDEQTRELGAARATIEAVRTFEASLAPAASPVAVFVDYNSDGTKRVRVEVSA